MVGRALSIYLCGQAPRMYQCWAILLLMQGLSCRRWVALGFVCELCHVQKCEEVIFCVYEGECITVFCLELLCSADTGVPCLVRLGVNAIPATTSILMGNGGVWGQSCSSQPSLLLINKCCGQANGS